MDAFTEIDDRFQKIFYQTKDTISFEDIAKQAGPSKKILKYRYNTDKITIVPIADPHTGHAASNLKMLAYQISYILNTPNCYTVLLGDLAEIATKTSIGMGSYEQDFGPGEQLKLLYKILKPLADADKILGSVIGNHEMRAMYTLDFNPMSALCEQLDVPFCGFQGYLVLDVGGNKYSVMVFHGKGGGTTPAGKLNSMYKLRDIATADIYLSGHTHTKMYDKVLLYEVNKETCILEPRTMHFITCGSTLEYWNNYAEMKGLRPEELGAIELTLSDKVEVRI